MSLETNELSKNAMGGTELMQCRLESYVDPDLLSQFQVIPSRVRDIDPHKKTVLWLHDLHTDPEVQHLKDGGWKKYDKLVFVSHWQQQMYKADLDVPYDAGIVLRNAIDPIEDHDKPNDGPIRLTYFSTPHRGLDILYHTFNTLANEHDVVLDVYSSFDLYGWASRDEPYKELFDKLNNHPKINYSKSVSNEEIRKSLLQSHILAYPSTWPETSCLVLIEAMSAGLYCVHSSLAALPETSLSLNNMYAFQEDKMSHANLFYNYLKLAVMAFENPEYRANLTTRTKLTKLVSDSVYSSRNRSVEWTNVLKHLLTTE